MPVRMVSYDVSEVSKEKVFNQAFKQGESFHVEGKLPDMKKTLTVNLHWKENGEKQQGKVIYNIAKTDLKKSKVKEINKPVELTGAFLQLR